MTGSDAADGSGSGSLEGVPDCMPNSCGKLPTSKVVPPWKSLKGRPWPGSSWLGDVSIYDMVWYPSEPKPVEEGSMDPFENDSFCSAASMLDVVGVMMCWGRTSIGLKDS